MEIQNELLKQLESKESILSQNLKLREQINENMESEISDIKYKINNKPLYWTTYSFIVATTVYDCLNADFWNISIIAVYSIFHVFSLEYLLSMPTAKDLERKTREKMLSSTDEYATKAEIAVTKGKIKQLQHQIDNP